MSSRYVIDPNKTTVTVAARSSMGPLVFTTQAVSGWVEADVVDGSIVAGSTVAEMAIDLASLRSGNDVYDAEIRRRIDARRYPTCSLTLTESRAVGERLALTGTVTMHGTTKPINGAVSVAASAEGHLEVTGEKALDIRDFAIPSPGILMMKIYPEVEVRLFLEAAAVDVTADEGGTDG